MSRKRTSRGTGIVDLYAALREAPRVHLASCSMRLLAIVVLFALAAHPGRAQDIATIPLGDPIYQSIREWVRAGVVAPVVIDQLPLSRRAVQRLIAEVRVASRASRNGTARQPQRFQRTLADAERRFGIPSDDSSRAGASFLGIDGASVSMATVSGEGRPVPPDSGLGATDAIVAPLFRRSLGAEGRDVLRGSALVVELDQTLSIGDRFAFTVTPQTRVTDQSAASGAKDVRLQAMAGRLRLANATLTLGRQSVRWGMSERDGLLLSANAAPLDMIELASDAPFRLPGVLRALGTNRASIFVADLGEEQFFPHTRLIGYRWSASPAANVGVAWSVLDFVGGRGAPRAPLGRLIANAFLGAVLPTEGYNFSNQMMGGEVQVRSERLGGTTVYLESNLDEFDGHLGRIWKSVWVEDGAHRLGAIVPIGNRDHGSSLGVELRHTGIRFNRHAQFRSGPTSRRTLLGEPLGPNADGVYAFGSWLHGDVMHIEWEGAGETYRSDRYRNQSNPYRVFEVEKRPAERRRRLVIGVRRDTPGGRSPSLAARAGVERVGGVGFVRGSTRTDALFALSARWAFR